MSDGPILIPGLNADEQDALTALIKQWRQKRPRNNLRAAFYDMKNSERTLFSKMVPPVVRQRRFVLGWSAIAVDKLKRRCNIDGFYDPTGTDLSSLGLGMLVRENRLLSEVSMAGTASLKHGVSWLVTTRGVDGEPEVLVTGCDATTATGMWDARRRTMSSFLSITDTDDQGEPIGMTLYLPNLNVVMAKDAGVWSVDRRVHADGMPVDPLVYRADIGRRFGRSRITRATMSIHMQALAAMIRADVNGEAYSLPRYAMLGVSEEAFRNADGSPKSTWEAAWDAIWTIGDDPEAEGQLARADVKQFPGQSPEPQNAHLRMLAQMFSGETGVPVGELGLIGDANPTSAEALTASRDDIISEAEQTTDGWEPDVSSAVTRALRMLNPDLPASVEVRPRWRSPMHLSRTAEADAGSKLAAAIPGLADTEVGLEMMGMRPDQVERFLAEKRRAAGRGVLTALREQAGGDALAAPDVVGG